MKILLLKNKELRLHIDIYKYAKKYLLSFLHKSLLIKTQSSCIIKC